MKERKIDKLITEKRQLLSSVRIIENQIWDLLKKYRGKLGKKIYFILKARLHEHKTLEEVGKDFNVTRERIRQLEALGLEKLNAFTRENHE
jgi:RNA polymerase primary sigma factor